MYLAAYPANACTHKKGDGKVVLLTSSSEWKVRAVAISSTVRK